MTTYAYLRVSTIDQNTEKNKLDVLKFANDKKLGNVEFVEEQISGKSNFKNRQLVKEGVILSPESSSHEKFVHGLKVLLAKNFIDNLKDETQKGRKKKVKNGFFIGQVPYGYMKINKRESELHPQKK